MKKAIKIITSLIVLLLALVIIFSTLWISNRFFITTFEPLLYTALMPIVDVSDILLIEGIKNCLIIPIIIILVIFITLYFLNKYNKLNKFICFIKDKSVLLSLTMLIVAVSFFCIKFKVADYIKNINDNTSIYEDYYVDPRNIEYTFPTKKRNLIFISLESMETSLYSKESGGAFDEDVIPELKSIASSGITFTPINKQGYTMAYNANWTMGSNVASLCGLPIGPMYSDDRTVTPDNFLPGAYGLGDILNDNGYHNVFICGEDAKFASTDSFFTKHGNYDILDHNKAIELNYTTEKIHWGFEDSLLFKIAKDTITELAKDDKPFNVFMATMDTHGKDGWKCSKCQHKYKQDVLNTFECSSKQVSEFINWLKEQDFYSNTTVVIMGDHISTSSKLNDVIDNNYVRKPYFVILNSPIQSANNSREFCTYDIFPTTLASLGVTFNSDRLAFGTNLFSNKKTLQEELGDKLSEELSKYSDYYFNKIFLNK